MRKAYYVACGLVYEMAFLAALAMVWRTESMFAAIVVAVPTGFLLSRCVTRTPAFRPVKDSLLWLGTVRQRILLIDWLNIARLCDVEIQESGALSAGRIACLDGNGRVCDGFSQRFRFPGVDGAAALKTSSMTQNLLQEFCKTLDFSLRIWYPI